MTSALTIPNNLRDKLAKHVERDAVAGGAVQAWSRIRTKGGRFNWSGNDVGTEIDVVIIGSVRQNGYWSESFSEGAANTPVCVAIDVDGRGEDHMVPFDSSPDKQADSCADCWANKWESSGRGKACRNSINLAVLPASSAEFNPAEEGALLSVPPASLKAFAAFADPITKGAGVPLYVAITTVKIVPKGGAFGLSFEVADQVEHDDLEALYNRAEEAWSILTREPVFGREDGEEDQPKRIAKGSQRKKKAAKKKGRSRRKV